MDSTTKCIAKEFGLQIGNVKSGNAEIGRDDNAVARFCVVFYGGSNI